MIETFKGEKASRHWYKLSCLKLSAGYHHWRSHNEYVYLTESEATLEVSWTLIRLLGSRRYDFREGEPDAPRPLIKITEFGVGGWFRDLFLRFSGIGLSTLIASIPVQGQHPCSTPLVVAPLC